jgi:recombination protein RecT
MTEKKNEELVKKDRNITDNVLKRFEETQAANAIDVPDDYSAANALKSAWFTLQTVKDRNDKLALETCTQESIANSLYEMVVNGLNPMKKQCYFIVYGGELTFMPSYQGNIQLAKRYSNVQSVVAREIYENDKFVTEILSDGREVLVKHEQPFENTNNKIIGAYCVVIDKNLDEHLTKMTISKITKAWMMGQAKGKSKLHTQFEDEAVKRTVINRACKPWINSSSDELIINEGTEGKSDKPKIKLEPEPEQKTIEIKGETVKEQPKQESNTKPTPNMEKEKKEDIPY